MYAGGRREIEKDPGTKYRDRDSKELETQLNGEGCCLLLSRALSLVPSACVR